MNVASAVTAIAIVRGTMILATVAWAIGEVALRQSRDNLARGAWTAGVALALVHVLLAFTFVYDWDHEAAVVATVRQAADRFGIGWRGGIYVNYVFVAVWLADTIWWWLAPSSRAARPAWVEQIRFAFFLFMFVNGAIVFAAGIGRVVGVAAVGTVIAARFVGQPQLSDVR